MNEWKNGWVYEEIDELMKEWMREWKNGWVNDGIDKNEGMDG